MWNEIVLYECKMVSVELWRQYECVSQVDSCQ